MEEKRIHIAFLLTENHAGRGGLETVLTRMTEGLKQYNIDSTVLMFHAPKNKEFLKKFKRSFIMPPLQHEEKYGFLPHFVAYPFWKYRLRKSTYNLIKNAFPTQAPDALVILSFSKTLIQIIPTLRAYQKKVPNMPIIAWPHSTINILNPKVLTALKDNISLFDNFLAISRGLKTEIINELHPQHISLIFNPIEKAPIIPRNARRLLYIGRIGSPDKQVMELLNILAELKGKWHLDMIGASDNPEWDKAVVTHAIQLDISDKVTFHGWVQNPWTVIQEAGVLLLNSRYEGFGLVLAEAMMRGIPCVSSDCPVGPNEIIHEGQNGWLYPLGDHQRCLSLIQDIIDEKLLLPDAYQIQQSVLHFESEHVIRHFKDQLLLAITKRANDLN